MATVKHPAFPTDTREVDNPDEWVAAGWLLAAQPFDNGGFLPPGVTEVTNDTGQPKAVTEAPKPREKK